MDYHKYILDTNRRIIIADFEGAYQNCADVWPGQNDVNRAKHQLITYLVESDPGNRTLDVGCGYGDFVAYLTGRGINAIGCDISPSAIRKGLARHPKGTRLEVGDLFQGLQYPDGSFDTILVLGVFQYYLDKVDAGLSEVERLLKPDGILVLSVCIPPNPIGREHVSDYQEFVEIVSRRFRIKDAILGYNHQDIVDGKPQREWRDDLTLFCTR
jgi:SAM-dependent methyltransferase